ncbi:hypothetical protein [Halovenus halobia]|uniref:hypothetical protein n=1 Tax=Halovenus halobia TaxID=3396622 RepID=UPI003F546633
MAGDTPRESAGQAGGQSPKSSASEGQPPSSGAPRQSFSNGAPGGQPPTTGTSGQQAGGGGESATRRQLLKAGVGFTAVGAVGYGYLRTRSDIVAATDGSPLDDVPGRSEFVFRWTGSELFTAEGFRAALDDELAALAISDATSTTELLDTVEAGTGIDPRASGAVVAFGRLPRASRNYAGLLFESSATPENVRAEIQQRGALTTTSTYREQTLWGLGSSRLEWSLLLAHLSGDRYGLATTSELEDVVDVRNGERARLGGSVRTGLNEAGEGMIRGGFVVPSAAFEGLDLPVVGLAENIEYGSVSLGDGVLTVRLVAPSGSVATDLEQTLTALSGLDRQTIIDQIGEPSPLVEVILAVLDDLETEVEGSVVRVTVADGFRVPAVLIGFLLDSAVN